MLGYISALRSAAGEIASSADAFDAPVSPASADHAAEEPAKGGSGAGVTVDGATIQPAPTEVEANLALGHDGPEVLENGSVRVGDIIYTADQWAALNAESDVPAPAEADGGSDRTDIELYHPTPEQMPDPDWFGPIPHDRFDRTDIELYHPTPEQMPDPDWFGPIPHDRFDRTDIELYYPTPEQMAEMPDWFFVPRRQGETPSAVADRPGTESEGAGSLADVVDVAPAGGTPAVEAIDFIA